MLPARDVVLDQDVVLAEGEERRAEGLRTEQNVAHRQPVQLLLAQVHPSPRGHGLAAVRRHEAGRVLNKYVFQI